MATEEVVEGRGRASEKGVEDAQSKSVEKAEATGKLAQQLSTWWLIDDRSVLACCPRFEHCWLAAVVERTAMQRSSPAKRE